MHLCKHVVTFLFLIIGLVHAFKFPNPFQFIPPAAAIAAASIKQEVVDAVSFTSNGKDASVETQQRVLRLVRTLETNFPVSDQLFTDPTEAQNLNGMWYLQYTSPSEISIAASADGVVSVENKPHRACE
jgi:hypothetical protein